MSSFDRFFVALTLIVAFVLGNEAQALAVTLTSHETVSSSIVAQDDNTNDSVEAERTNTVASIVVALVCLSILCWGILSMKRLITRRRRDKQSDQEWERRRL